MIRRTLISLMSLGLLSSLAACGGSPEDTASPPVSEPAAEPSTPIETSAMTPSETSDASDSPEPSENTEPSETPDSSAPSSEPTNSEDSTSTGEIPSVIQGRWITFGEGETPRDCTEDLENGGAIITIDATKISSFAFSFELEEIQESNANSMESLFTYADDSDQPMTPMIRLETQDDWETLALIELGTKQAPALYARCS